MVSQEKNRLIFIHSRRHGPLDKCPIAQYEELALDYLGAEEGSEKRAVLERRFGKVNLRRMVATYQEEKANMEYLKGSTTMCPGCRCNVEKNMGCNHVSFFVLDGPRSDRCVLQR
jgi:E3 ubiquitin-protein ligase RNF14